MIEEEKVTMNDRGGESDNEWGGGGCDGRDSVGDEDVGNSCICIINCMSKDLAGAAKVRK